MNSRQKEVEKEKLAEEKRVLQRLKRQYNSSAKEIDEKVKKLQENISDLAEKLRTAATTEEATIIRSQIQSKVYRQGYQLALREQIDAVIDELNHSQGKTIDDYFNGCYDDGFIGTMYDLHGQGIPLILPVKPKDVAQAIKLDSKVSNKLYKGYVDKLKKSIQSEISRGIVMNESYTQIALHISNTTNAGFNNTMRIVRTEGHRIQCESASNAQHEAKKKGADVVKSWDSTLDGKTRDSHRTVDGQIKELDEKFSNGLMYPGDSSGGASEVVNCRCALLQRARWALDDEELEILKNRAAFYGLDKTEDFNDYKKKYLNATK